MSRKMNLTSFFFHIIMVIRQDKTRYQKHSSRETAHIKETKIRHVTRKNK